MKRLLLIFACAAALAGDSDPDAAAIMMRVLTRVRQTTRNIPRYACVETVTRDYYAATAPVLRSCDAILASREHPTPDLVLRHLSTDRLRLEVGMSARGEMHSWLGASRFNDSSIDTLVTDGPMGTGAFAGFLAATFDQDVKSYVFLRQTVTSGVTRVRFGFDVPVQDSHYKVKLGNDWVETAYGGIFEADPETGAVDWIEIKTAILPPSAGSCQTTTRLDLGPEKLGSREFLVTRRARQQFAGKDGGQVVSTIQFSGCREYRGESTISFETDGPLPDGGPDVVKGATPGLELPVDRPFALELRTPIDTATAAAGDRFTARLTTAIHDYYGRTLVPRNAAVEGRILRVQAYHQKPVECIVVLRPESVEVRGVRYPLAANGDLRAARDQQRPITGGKKGALIILPFQSETNAALYRFPGDRAILKRGFVSHWVTAYRRSTAPQP